MECGPQKFQYFMSHPPPPPPPQMCTPLRLVVTSSQFFPPPPGQSMSCSTGFNTQELTTAELFREADLTSALQSTSLKIPYEQQRIIPGIPLNCSGAITNWTIGAEWRRGGGRNLFPQLQVWRSTEDGCSYALIGDTKLFVPGGNERPRGGYIFSGTPDPAVEFQTGDILGIFQPRESKSRVRVYYDTSTGPTNYYNDIGDANQPPQIRNQEHFVITSADGWDMSLPLLSVEICKFTKILYILVHTWYSMQKALWKSSCSA